MSLRRALRSGRSQESAGPSGGGSRAVGSVKAIGTLEVLGILGMILPGVLNTAAMLVPLVATGLALMMVGAAATHTRRGEDPNIVANLHPGRPGDSRRSRALPPLSPLGTDPSSMRPAGYTSSHAALGAPLGCCTSTGRDVSRIRCRITANWINRTANRTSRHWQVTEAASRGRVVAMHECSPRGCARRPSSWDDHGWAPG